MKATAVELTTAVWKVLLLLVVAVAALALTSGANLIVSDLESRTEMFDGIGMFFGLLIAGAATVVAVPPVTALLLHRSRARAAMVVAGVLGQMIAVIGVVSLPVGFGPLWVLGCLVLGGLLVGTSTYLFEPIASRCEQPADPHRGA